MAGPPVVSRAIVPPSTGVCFGTPRWLYDWLDARFRFTLDPCPLNDAAIWDGLERSWHGERVFCNPPYGRRAIPRWLKKRFEPEVAVYLLPARTDTEWWHEWVLREASEIIYCRNRIAFVGMKTPAYFASVIIVYDGRGRTPITKSLWLTDLEPQTRGYRLPGVA